MAEVNDSPVLELRDEAPKRAFLTIAGTKYHYARRDDLSIEDILNVQRVGQRFGEVTDLAMMDAEGAKQLTADVRAATTLVMHDMPDDVIADLTDMECLAVIEGFSKAMPQTTNAVVAPEISSPASAASTPESPQTDSSE